MLQEKFFSQENLARANGLIFNAGNPNNEVTVKQLAEMMTQVEAFFNGFAFFFKKKKKIAYHSILTCMIMFFWFRFIPK